MNRLGNIFTGLLIICGAGLVLTGCSSSESNAPKGGGRPSGLSAEGFVVKEQPFSSTYEASGSLLPNEEVEIHPEISGRVTGIHFREGSNVSSGQLLVQLYDEEIKAQLKKLKAQRELQSKTIERQKALLEIGGISKQEFETTETQGHSLDADIAYAEAQLRATKILAPFSGTIGIRNISVGAVVSPQTVIASLQQTHQLKIDFTIPDRYRSAISAGKEVMFSVTGMTDTLAGKILAIDPGADPVTRTIKVRATVSNNNRKLVAGSFAHVIVPIETENNAILVPSQSVIPTTKDKLVAVVRNGKADLVKVILGTRTSDKVEVLNGLQHGDTILTTGIMQVKQGMDVKVTGIKS